MRKSDIFLLKFRRWITNPAEQGVIKP